MDELRTAIEERRKLVDDYFPDAPEKCKICPGLLNAAKHMNAITKNIVKEGDRQQEIFINHLSIMFPKVMAIAEEMYLNCSGASFSYIRPNDREQNIIIGITATCNSITPTGYFIEPSTIIY